MWFSAVVGGGGETFIRIDDLFTYPPDIILFPLVAIPYTWNFLINHSQNKSFNLYIISLCLLSCIFRYIANIFLLIKLKRWKLYSLLHPGKLPSCPHWTEPPHILILIISASSSGKKNLYEVLFEHYNWFKNTNLIFFTVLGHFAYFVKSLLSYRIAGKLWKI